MQFKKDITFICMDQPEYQNIYPVYEEAIRRGYKAKITFNKFEKCEIGVYCQHENFPQFSRFSVIMLHDIIQGYGRWPDIWFSEPWNKYDIGILPGKQWGKMWEETSKFFYARPRKGVYEVGWPKADILGELDMITVKEKMIKKYGLDHTKKTVLYAPAWENDGKQDDFVRAMQGLNVNILIKQYPATEDIFPDSYKNIQEMYKLHKGIPGVYILDSEINILDAIAMSDVLVSEESSTMCEAVMLGKPAVSVSNWLIPDVKPSRFPKDDYSFVVKTKKENLSECVEEILSNYEKYHKYALEYSAMNYSNIGKSSEIIMDILDGYTIGKKPTAKKLQPNKNREYISLNNYFTFKVRRLKNGLILNWAERFSAVNQLHLLYKKMRKR